MFASGYCLCKTCRFVTVKHGSTTRAVEVAVRAQEGVNVVNLQELAEKAYRSVSKEIKIKDVTVKVRILGGR